MMTQNWIIRDAVGTDLPFIYSTWSKSYRYDSALGKSCRNSIFFPYFNRVMDWILSQDDTQVIVAADPANPNVVYGYLITQPNIVHYAFTKEAFQRWGICLSLMQKAGMPQTYTLKTFMCKPIVGKHPEMDFNPFLLFKLGDIKNGEGEEGIGEGSASLFRS